MTSTARKWPSRSSVWDTKQKRFSNAFRAERQILASLDHPYIARLLDGGATPRGLPYLVMELIEGFPITRYVNDRALSIPDRLRLFGKVCEAVQYAHGNLTVHRDLKPANILVDRDGAPKLLDFGVAKLLSPEGNTAVTGVQSLTPDYTSPEQIRGLPVTTRTDVYSLGLILYEVLCGERAQTADASSPLALDRSICQTEPRPPSERAATRGDHTLARQLRGDLDTIVAMAIRKEPERRYHSAAALSDDLRRYLEGRPVDARPGTLGYRVGKLVGRHRIAVVAAVLVIASIAGGVIATVYQARPPQPPSHQIRNPPHPGLSDS